MAVADEAPDALRRLDADGERRGAPSRRARWIADVWARLFLTYAAVPPTDPDFASDRELRRFAQEVLAPMVSR